MRKPISIRTSLLRGQTVVLILLGVVLIGATFVGARQAVATLLSALVERRVDHVETELRRYFQPVGGGLLALVDWGREGMVSLDRPEELSRLLRPLFRQQPQLARILVVDGSGAGLALRRVAPPEGSGGSRAWTSIEVEVTPIQPSSGEVESEWWRGAIELLDDPSRALHLSPVQSLEGEGLVMTASVAFRLAAGRVGDEGGAGGGTGGGTEARAVAVAMQTRLEGLIDFVRSLELTDRDLISVLTDDLRLLAMSDSPELWSGPPEGWILQRPGDLGSSLVADAVEAFIRRPEGETGPLEFAHRGEVWWTQLRRFPLGGDDALFVSVLVPDADLGENRNLIRLSIFAVILLALLVAVFGSVRLSRRVSGPIEVLVRNSERIRRGDLEAGEPVTSRLVEVQALAVAQERMRQGLRSLVKLEGDLQAARRIQRSSLPEALPTLDGWELAAWSEPAEETGGDAYDAIALGEEARPSGALLLVADATGHGIGAALSAVRFAAMVRVGALVDDDLGRLARLLNQELCAELPGNRFVSAWLGRVDAAGDELATFSAGLAPLLLLRRDAERSEVLAADAPPFGLREDLETGPPTSFRMGVGDVYLAVTDGLFEAVDDRGDELGIQRIAAVLERERERSAREILDALRAEVRAFTGRRPADDDRTAVVIKRTHGSG